MWCGTPPQPFERPGALLVGESRGESGDRNGVRAPVEYLPFSAGQPDNEGVCRAGFPWLPSPSVRAVGVDVDQFGVRVDDAEHRSDARLAWVQWVVLPIFTQKNPLKVLPQLVRRAGLTAQLDGGLLQVITVLKK